MENYQTEIKKESLAKLFKGGELYCPDYRGQGDILVVGSVIARIAKEIPVTKDFINLQTIDATNRILTPGFIDQHAHLIGAGGFGGPTTRTREIKIQQITRVGVTTIVGCLGFDTLTCDLKRLLVKAMALEAQGITTLIYTGSFTIPTITITGSVESDLLLINKVVGVKLGMGEVTSTHPDEKELKGLLVASYRGAALSGKVGIVHIHLGNIPGPWFNIMEKILHESDIPYSQVIFTHVNKNSQVFGDAIEFAKKGGMVDITAEINPDVLPPNVAKERQAKGLRKPSRAIEEMLEAGVSEDNLTLSSDSNAGAPLPNGHVRYTSIATLYKEFRDLARKTNNLPLALKMVTLNPARRLGIILRKGTLDESKDADLLVLTQDLQIEEVYARGKLMVKDGNPIVTDPFE